MRFRVELVHFLDRRVERVLALPDVILPDVAALGGRAREVRVAPEESIGESAGRVVH